MLTLRQMRYFEALATTRHFGRAADLVHISQPALSAQIMEMENYLGAKLVERTRGSTILTRKGEEVLTHVHTILHEVDRLERSVRREGGVLDGLIRIGIIPTVAPYLVPQFVPYLRRAYPNVEIELKEAVTSRLLADLAEGRLDAVIAALPLEGEGIRTRSLFTDRFFMAMAENGDDVLMSPLTENEVDVDRLLLLEEGHCLREQALSVCGAGKRSLVNFGATSMTTLLQMVSHDMGMTLIPEMAVATETGRTSIRIVPFAEPQPSREIGLAWRRNNQSDIDMQALADAVIAASPAPVAG
ncbi:MULTISPECIES: hydrogen peroxide-inducible genes activator [Rhizobium]|uniref:LysR substrate-binding domain-containing protein n=1 Tax=Rhizobium rhododendri TaxID=2506430 RepID=A0ABY8IHY0_9HYPH|nr:MULTISPECIES: hydrogen peroxide-inducible genes activator [Rhizobium]MBZ5760472.1 LysR family transcriptional regulator [Rhizobium sp. VS19-DR96]MBZ5766684.1 LysR family transcriptional regulator [Rhizobium sp. VS19-DR129.2]MBZ5773323.1 LysR family transcriptional regulator [Rhizobium sp. VS19-DRK62.2]MBZ5784307.1 LysR family transcriptional regulator [Rhizobium sp. VS19-DR121]MBZ5802667.1 LysR family transcriptional regulator [Rhizobium sp. VS19-DR181]